MREPAKPPAKLPPARLPPPIYMVFTDRDGVRWQVYAFNDRHYFHDGTPYKFPGEEWESRGFVPDDPPHRPRRLYRRDYPNREADYRCDRVTLQRQLDASEIDRRDRDR